MKTEIDKVVTEQMSALYLRIDRMRNTAVKARKDAEPDSKRQVMLAGKVKAYDNCLNLIRSRNGKTLYRKFQ